jgi:hypothetical protein
VMPNRSLSFGCFMSMIPLTRNKHKQENYNALAAVLQLLAGKILKKFSK